LKATNSRGGPSPASPILAGHVNPIRNETEPPGLPPRQHPGNLTAADPCQADVESLIADARADLTPAQMVERKLLSLLKGRLLPVSHVRLANLPRSRGRG
jgi:hypothetical protein